MSVSAIWWKMKSTQKSFSVGIFVPFVLQKKKRDALSQDAKYLFLPTWGWSVEEEFTKEMQKRKKKVLSNENFFLRQLLALSALGQVK